MSVKLMGLVWSVTFPTQSQKLIALKIADHSNDEGGNIWPSKSRIAREVGCSQTTVQLTLKVFRDVGLLHVIEEGGRGPRSTTKYALNTELLSFLANTEGVLSGTADQLTVKHGEMAKGSESDGVGFRWDRTEPDKGSESDEKGVGITDPKPSLKNHHLEPPLRAGAREGENFDLGSEGVKPSPSLPVFTIQPADTSWGAWIEHFRKTGRDEFAVDATEKRRICASSRWPQENTVVFEPKPRKALSKTSKRMTGDAA